MSDRYYPWYYAWTFAAIGIALLLLTSVRGSLFVCGALFGKFYWKDRND